MLINVRATILLQFGKGLCKKSVHLSHMDRFSWSLSMVILPHSFSRSYNLLCYPYIVKLSRIKRLAPQYLPFTEESLTETGRWTDNIPAPPPLNKSSLFESSTFPAEQYEKPLISEWLHFDQMVVPVGIEPTTHGFSVHCSTDWATGPFGCGGRIWTNDLRVMSPTSYQAALPRDV